MVNWEDREYVNPRKKVFKNLDTEEILILELQDDPDNVTKEGVPVSAHNLNKMQTDLVSQSVVYYKDLNDINNTSYCYTSASATNKPPQANGTNGYVFTQMVNDNVGYQTYKTTNAEYERFKNVTWGEWEIKNTVKITTGQEFKTGRIIDGKEEYGKRIDFGALPNNTSKTVSHGINFSKSSFISMQCDFQETNYKISFQNYGVRPQTTNEPIIAFVGNTVIGIKTVSDMSAYTGFATIYYTKN